MIFSKTIIPTVLNLRKNSWYLYCKSGRRKVQVMTGIEICLRGLSWGQSFLEFSYELGGHIAWVRSIWQRALRQTKQSYGRTTMAFRRPEHIFPGETPVFIASATCVTGASNSLNLRNMESSRNTHCLNSQHLVTVPRLNIADLVPSGFFQSTIMVFAGGWTHFPKKNTRVYVGESLLSLEILNSSFKSRHKDSIQSAFRRCVS